MQSTEPNQIQAAASLELQDIQGMIVSGYGHLSHSKYLFLGVEDAGKAKAWLRSLLQRQQITSCRDAKPPQTVNLAVTWTGVLRAKSVFTCSRNSSRPVSMSNVK